jgi:hypothetical protein
MPQIYRCSWPGCPKVSPPLEPAQLARRGGQYFCPEHAQRHAMGQQPEGQEKGGDGMFSGVDRFSRYI